MDDRFRNFAATYGNRDRRFPSLQRIVENDVLVARYRTYADTRRDKSFGFHDSNKRRDADAERRKLENRESGRKREAAFFSVQINNAATLLFTGTKI